MVKEKNNGIVKIYIVDDHEIVRRGLIQFINNHDGLEICGEASDANSAIAGLNDTGCNLAIVDISLEGISGIDLIKAIRKRYKEIKIIALSMYSGSDNVERAIKSGAMGYVLKSQPVEQIIEAINCITNGKTYFSPPLRDKIFNIIISSDGSDAASPKVLTEREFEIFKLIGQGLNRHEISKQLNISTSTIGTYRNRIKSKLNISSPAELVKYAFHWVSENSL